MVRRRVGREHVGFASRTRQQIPYLRRILRPSSGSSGIREGMREHTPGRLGGGESGDGALEVLKAECEVRTPSPSDVLEERRRPCRAQWVHDLYGLDVGEARSPALIHPSAWKE